MGTVVAMAQPQPQSLPSQGDRSASAPLPSLTTDAIAVEHLHFPAGEGSYHAPDGPTLFVNLTARPIHYLQRQDGRTHTGFYRQGDFTVTPADVPFFARWQGTEDCLQIRFSDRFLQRVAAETLAGQGDRAALVPTFQQRDAQMGAMVSLLCRELQQAQPGTALYVDSLANLLAVQLLRSYGSRPASLPSYDGGLPPPHLRRVLDYLDAHLSEDVKLADLSQLLAMSPFHFSRLFKQSLGISPHQYLIQQRVERAKQLLKQTDQAIAAIAFDCGFSSHSHLTKQFRHLTGTTPKAYRHS